LRATRCRSVTPVHKGPGRHPGAERALKAVLNPGNGTVRGMTPATVVVATANHLDAEPTGYANGEVGTVLSCGDKLAAGGVHRRRVQHRRQGR